jgi:hypothetical protein
MDKKMAQIRQILKILFYFILFYFKLQDLYDKIQQVAKNREGFLVFLLLSYLVCSQIWLN